MSNKILKLIGSVIAIGVATSLISTESKAREAQKKSQHQAYIPQKDSLADRIELKVIKIESSQYNNIEKTPDEIVMTIEIDNTSGIILSDISGNLMITDDTGVVIAITNYNHNQVIPLGQSIKKISFPISSLGKSSQRLIGLSNWSTEFKPDKISG